MKKEILVAGKVLLAAIYSFLFVNVMIGLMGVVLYLYDILLYDILGNIILYLTLFILVVSVMWLLELYMRIRSGKVSREKKIIIGIITFILSIVGLMVEYSFLFAEDWAFLFGPAGMFIGFMVCLIITPIWFRKRKEDRQLASEILWGLIAMTVVDVAVFFIIMDMP